MREGLDALARHIANDEDAVVARIRQVAGQPIDDDGVEFRSDTAVVWPIQEDAFYPGVSWSARSW